MVAIVVVDDHAGRLALALQPAPDARERPESGGQRRDRHIQGQPGPGHGEGVRGVVPPGGAQARP